MARREIAQDQYFTTDADAKRFIDILNDRYDLNSFDITLEPSAGSGAFLKFMPKHNRVGLDLTPMHEEVVEQDFFDYDSGHAPFTPKKIISIGNPPFGRRGSLAKQFINKCAEFSEVIAFVLPAIFSKYTFINSMPPNFHLVYEEYVNEFVLPDGTPHPVKCVFQIWENRWEKRKQIVKEKFHPDFDMIHRHVAWTSEEEMQQIEKDYDFAFGQISGKVQDIKNVKKGSQFFVKANVPGVRERFEKMNRDEYIKYSMGATSLTRPDVVEMYYLAITKEFKLISDKYLKKENKKYLIPLYNNTIDN